MHVLRHGSHCTSALMKAVAQMGACAPRSLALRLSLVVFLLVGCNRRKLKGALSIGRTEVAD